MSSWTYVSAIREHVGQEVTLKGWLANRRSSGKLHFLQVRDGTGTIQCVMEKKIVGDEPFDAAGALPLESSLAVSGTVREDPRSPIGFELAVTAFSVVAPAGLDYPIQKKEAGTDFLMDHRHLWLRSRRQQAILAVRAEIIRAIRDHLDSQGFTLIDAPILTPAACEGTSTLFETDYFGDKAYLTQSGQLYMEAAAMAFGRVYCFGPTFRAEKSKTRRHLTEFWMVEPEMAFVDLDGDMAIIEDLLVAVVARVLDRRREELKVVERDVSKLEAVRKPFPRMRYDEAIEVLKRAGASVEWGADFGGDEETILSRQHDSPLLVHRYPADVKAFYMKRDPQDPRLALAVDVLAPEGYGEIVGGSQREDDLAVLEASLERHKLPREAFEWYLDLRRYGTVTHSGFGIGIERTVAWICGLPHIRETIPFPRLMSRLSP
ncbi:MAG: asparagine--tRNA ligase [Deltaproteobacteria bacterium]|nr:asparagine--tRNA ligase [Deltaproteobacteria bacterium]